MPPTAQPKTVHPHLLFSSINPYIGDPAHELFENLRAAPLPPTRHQQEHADQIRRNEGMELSREYNLTSADGVGHPEDTRHGRVSTLLQDPKEDSSSVDLLKSKPFLAHTMSRLHSQAEWMVLCSTVVDFDVAKKRSPGRSIASFFGFGRTKKGDGDDGFHSQQESNLEQEGSRQTQRNVEPRNRSRTTTTPIKTAIARAMTSGHPAKPLPSVPLDSKESAASSSQETGFRRFVHNPIQSRKTATEYYEKVERKDITAETTEPDTRRTRFTTGLRNSVLGLLVQVKDALLPLEVAQNDPSIRQRGQATFYCTTPGSMERRGLPRSKASQFRVSPRNGNKMTGNEICEPWLVEALTSFDEESSAREYKGRNQGREKATTPSQKIIRQTKASWTGQAPDNSTSDRKTHGVHTDDRPLITRSQTVHRSAHREVPARLSLWSDSLLPEDALNHTVKQGRVRSGHPRRQTQTFHEVPTSRYSESKPADTKAYKSSRRLQVITGVPCESKDQQRQRKVKEYRNTFERNNEGNHYQRIPAMASSMSPLHNRRESSVYCMAGGPATPPPNSPLPAIPTSSSLTSCRSSSSKASLLYTPVSPIPTLSTSASTWSWRLNADSPGIQLLNEMKNATEVVGKTHKPDMIPTKRHAQQRSITSSLSSAGLLDEVPALSRQIKTSSAGDARHEKPSTSEESTGRLGRHNGSHTRPTGKSASVAIPAPPPRPETSQAEVGPKKQQEGSQSSKSTASNSAGSPSSIVNLYMSRSQQTIAGNE
ncbi:hypothetical protein QFC22_003068 [Naganishia vaughanmartiniae]|uniref:Uncharacterized protein n=1 Tax=Naganishia vaughanmartiniae TaxID=1424756 RepID=A0ACC2X9S9_9TREE|nr:hypothetical protein QFC22_003068 [Naganishia vaughanmartiniae]